MTTTDTRDPVARWNAGADAIRARERDGNPPPESWYTRLDALYAEAAAWETAQRLTQGELFSEGTGRRYR